MRGPTNRFPTGNSRNRRGRREGWAASGAEYIRVRAAQGQIQPASVILLAGGRRATISDCLEGLSQQHAAPEPVVTVVDSVPSDGTADFALHRPDVHWVLLTSQMDPGIMCQEACSRPASHWLAFLDAACRPSPGWLAAGVDALAEGADVVLGEVEGGTEGTAGFANFFVARHVPFRIPLAGPEGPDRFQSFVYQCRAAGFEVVIEPRARVKPIVTPGGLSPQSLIGSAPSRKTPPGVARSVRGFAPASPPTSTGLISVVLCTAGTRPKHLDSCFASLAQLDDDNFEVVVVDNSAHPVVGAKQLVSSNVKLVHEPSRGLDRARDRGIEESRGEIVAFIDDDCEVDPGWIKGLRASFADPVVQFVTGRVRPASLEKESQLWFEKHFSFDRGPFPQRFTRFDNNGLSPLLMGALGTGANMAFRRSLLERVGAFDPALDMGTLVGGGGDLDIFARALDEGEVCEYAPDAVIFHYHRDSLSKLRCQTWGYGVSQGALCAKCVLSRRGRRVHGLRRYVRLLRDHQRRLRHVRNGTDQFPADLVSLELFGIAIGPLAYVASRLQQRLRTGR